MKKALIIYFVLKIAHFIQLRSLLANDEYNVLERGNSRRDSMIFEQIYFKIMKKKLRKQSKQKLKMPIEKHKQFLILHHIKLGGKNISKNFPNIGKPCAIYTKS